MRRLGTPHLWQRPHQLIPAQEQLPQLREAAAGAPVLWQRAAQTVVVQRPAKV